MLAAPGVSQNAGQHEPVELAVDLRVLPPRLVLDSGANDELHRTRSRLSL
jgi:hypothetical protein